MDNIFIKYKTVYVLFTQIILINIYNFLFHVFLHNKGPSKISYYYAVCVKKLQITSLETDFNFPLTSFTGFSAVFKSISLSFAFIRRINWCSFGTDSYHIGISS